MPRKCKHENADHLMPGDNPDWYAYKGPQFIAQCEQLRCLDCCAWLSLGHSDETDERVAVELRAATIAASVVNDGESLLRVTDCTHREWVGWAAHASMPQFKDVSLSPTQMAGYLARCIVEHKDGES